jgi:4-carboxymuconolactone decarboxylase
MWGGSFGDEILEIAKVAYHSTGYAGFPAGNMACKLAREVFDAQT